MHIGNALQLLPHSQSVADGDRIAYQKHSWQSGIIFNGGQGIHFLGRFGLRDGQAGQAKKHQDNAHAFLCPVPQQSASPMGCLAKRDPCHTSSSTPVWPMSWSPQGSLVVIIAFSLLALRSPAQDGNGLPQVESLEQALEQLQSAESTPESEALAQATTEVIGALNAVKSHRSKLSQFSTEGIDVALTQLQEQAKEAPKEASMPNETASLELLASELQQLEADRKAEAEALQDLNAETARRAERRQQLPEVIANAKKELESLQTDRPEVIEGNAALVERQGQLQQAKIERQKALIASLEAESSFYGQAAELHNERIAVSQNRLERLTSESTRWQEAVALARSKDASEIEKAATARASDDKRHPYLRALDREIVALAKQRIGEEGTTEQRRQVSARSLELDNQRKDLRRQFADAKQQVDLVTQSNLDLGDTTARLLLQLRKQLPQAEATRLEMEIAARKSALNFLDAKSLNQQLRWEAGSLDAATELGLAQAEPIQAIDDEDRVGVREQIRESLEIRQGLLKVLKDDKETLRTKYREVSVELQLLLKEAESIRQYVDENIPWLRSQEAWAWGHLKTDLLQSHNLLSGSNITAFPLEAWKSLFRHPLLWLAWVAILALLLYKRSYLKDQLNHTSEIASLRSCTRYDVTVRALLITCLLAAPLSLALFFPAWRAVTSGGPNLAHSLLHGASYAIFYAFLYQSLRKNGLAISHFDFSEGKCQRLRKALQWFAPCYFVTLVLVDFYRREAVEHGVDGRAFYFIHLILLVVFLIQCVGILMPSQRGRFRRALIYGATLFIPAGLALASWLGYQYAVVELEHRLRITAWLTLGAAVIFYMSKRAILVARRRLRKSQIQAERAARLAESEGVELPPEEALEDMVDATDAQRQSDRLIRAVAVVLFSVAVWSIWSDLLPALNALDRVTVIENVGGVTAEEGTGAEDTANSPAETVAETLGVVSNEADDAGVSVADILKALLAFFLTYVAVRNIPGLLEVAILQHVKLERGSSYAISTLVRYALVIVGLLIGFGALSVSWSKVQWLAAAVTVGIGFGLQEIFANFVAGLILLFERPMRVGDIVSVGETSGRVTQIRMRATTITAFNNRELVVPNKSFITSDFINWTLTDSVLRVEIAVGVAYGSDAEQVSALLEKLGREHPLSLDDPAPSVVFKAFGSSTLDFELRVHVGKVEDLLPVKNALHFSINRAFEEAGIEIAFPQLDVNLKTPASNLG